ncbi:MAG: hypothetical protein EOO85_04625 [Pedobacter sp.]|nr:MAG: hypothetical protein EOO85_04625 [Pedobacter sp.]
MKALIDSTLSAELQELYLENKEWLSNVLYLQDELRFFRNLYSQILANGVDREHLAQLAMVSSSMNYIELRRKQLKKELDARKFQISQLLTDSNIEIKVEFIEEDTALILEIKSIMLAEATLKSELFKLSKQQKLNCRLHTPKKVLRVQRYPLL